VFALDRFFPVPIGHNPARARRPGWRAGRRRSSAGRFERVRAVLPAVCAIGIASAAGWMLAGGNLASSELLFRQAEPAAVESSSGAPVHIDSSPPGAVVHIDGTSYGKTPLDVRLSPGQYTLSLQHPDALDDEQILQVADTGARVDAGLWRRRPDVVALRPVYPGAPLLDARFLNDGQVALLVGLASQAGTPRPNRELWRLDPVTGQLARVGIPEMDTPVTSLVLSPDGGQVAYVKPGSSSALTNTGWPTGASAATAPPKASQPESVWVVPLDGDQPPRRIFELSSVSTPATTADPEHIVDLVWTPEGARLVAITRQTGPPARARVFLLHVAEPADADSQLADGELVLVPAVVLPDSAVPDPRGRWLALVTQAAVAPGGNNLLNLCILQLQPGGIFRDVADLGSAASAPTASPVAWPPTIDSPADRLVFVAPAPAAASSGGGLFGIFSALRPSAPPSGLYMARLEASGLQDAQPRRLGTAINTFGPVWRSESALLGFARQDDGMLALRSIDPTSGAVRDLGVRLPAAVGQGTGLAAHWNTSHGYALLLSHPSNGGTVGVSLQGWLVSFASPSSSAAGALH
jgi:hypothetical protein